jgi:hypothetical protein
VFLQPVLEKKPFIMVKSILYLAKTLDILCIPAAGTAGR